MYCHNHAVMSFCSMIVSTHCLLLGYLLSDLLLLRYIARLLLHLLLLLLLRYGLSGCLEVLCIRGCYLTEAVIVLRLEESNNVRQLSGNTLLTSRIVRQLNLNLDTQHSLQQSDATQSGHVW